MMYKSLLWAGVLLVGTGISVQAGEHPLEGALANFGGKCWITLRSHDGHYEVRLLTDEQKTAAEETIARYRGETSSGASDRSTNSVSNYRSLATDVRGGRFYNVSRVTHGIEVSADGVRALIPFSSIGAVLYGPESTLVGNPIIGIRGSRSVGSSASGRFGAVLGSAGEALGRFGDSGTSRMSSSRSKSVGGRSSGGVLRSRTTGVVGRANSVSDQQLVTQITGLLGGASKPANPETAEKRVKPAPQISIYHLKHADPDSLSDILAIIYEEADLRIAINHRLNALVVRSDASVMKEVESLVEALDCETPPTATAGKDLRFGVYATGEMEPKTVVNALVTVLADSASVRLDIDPKQGTIFAYGSEEEHATIKAIIEQLSESE